MTDRPRHLRAIDSESGEVFDECPSCIQYERDLRVMKAKLTRLQRDQEAEARRHKLYAEAQCLHDWWRLASGHFGVKFTAEDFHSVKPRIEEAGTVGVLKAVAGIAYDPSTKRMRNGRLKRFDEFSLLTRSSEKLRSFQERAPGGEDDDRTWRKWLVDRIESNLTDKED